MNQHNIKVYYQYQNFWSTFDLKNHFQSQFKNLKITLLAS